MTMIDNTLRLRRLAPPITWAAEPFAQRLRANGFRAAAAAAVGYSGPPGWREAWAVYEQSGGAEMVLDGRTMRVPRTLRRTPAEVTL